MSRPVFFDHDGGIDDFLSLLLLVTYGDVDLLGISITPADTVIEAALPATRKILQLAGRTTVAVGGGTLEGPHPFPLPWRTDAFKVNDLPVLNQHDELAVPASDEAGQELLARTIASSPEPVTLLMTGPLTNLAWALDHYPSIEGNVKELVFMGGALDVSGNVQEPGHDGSAEWNVYWDPPGSSRVWESSIPITMFPLDATDQVPVTQEFRRSFGKLYRIPLAAAAGTLWAMTSAWGIATGMGLPYYCWDTLTTSYLAEPDICSFREVTCRVEVGGPSDGRTLPTPEGRPVRVAADVDAKRFYEHCLRTLQR